MKVFSLLKRRFRGETSGAYVCTLCGATFDDRPPVVCPDCRGFVVARDE